MTQNANPCFRLRRWRGWVGLVLLAVGWGQLWAATRLRIGVESAAPPIAYLGADGKPTGFSVALLREMERAGGFEVELVPGFWRQNLERFKTGEIDALANIIATGTNEAEFDLSIGHAWVHGIVYRRPDRAPVRHTRDFAGKNIATVKGTAANSIALRQTAWRTNIRTYDSAQEAFDAVERGECDAVLFSNRGAFAGANERRLVREFVDDLTFRFHFAVKVGDRANLARLNQSLASVIESGAFARLYREWVGPIEPRPILLDDLRPYFWPLALGLLAVGGFVGWQRHLLRRLTRQAEQLRISEERWNFALAGSGAAVWDWDITAGRMVCSQHWHELLGLSGKEIGSRREDVDERVHPDDRAKVVAAREAHWRDATVPFEVEFRMRCHDGSWKWVMDRGRVVSRTPEGKPQRMIGTCTDLTARREQETDRLIMGKLESTGILAGGIAHDFNNLLTVITLNLDVLQMERLDHAGVKRHLDEVRQAARAASSLTQQLITFAEGGMPIRQPVALGALVRESAQFALSGSNVAAQFQLAEGLWPAMGDGAQLGQVFRNLVLNAREAMVAGGTVEVRASNVAPGAAEVRGLPAGDYVRVSVTDHGPGIAPEMLAAIFDPYFSTKQRGTQRGMGLGLTICHAVVKKHDGAITVESVLGEGATFHVYLPATREVSPPVAALPKEAGGVQCVLVMDDEEAVRVSVGRILQQQGYQVELAATGEEAVTLFLRRRQEGRTFAAVVLDLTVRGGMGGLETLHKLQAVDSEVTAIVMSGYAKDEVLRAYRRHGFKSALAKPFSADDLRRALVAALGGGTGPA